jgi:phosphoglycolate phosphatase-like HAD superfamily hydrolase
MSGPGAIPSNWSWRDEPCEPGATVVFDIDGVLSDAAGRQRFLMGEDRDWDAFFEACGEDPLVTELARLLELLGVRPTPGCAGSRSASTCSSCGTGATTPG